MERGIHVLIEKPMTVSAEEARAIAALARAKALHVLVPYGWNFKSFFAEARALGARGTNRPHSPCQRADGDACRRPDVGVGPRRNRAGNVPAGPANLGESATGGYGWGQLIHMLGGLFYLTDLAPKDVFAFVGRSELGADLYDAAVVRFADGATAALSGAATVPAGSPFQVDIRIFGDAGMLLLDVERERVSLRRFDGDNVDVAIADGDGAYACVEPVHRFVDLCLGRPVENCADASHRPTLGRSGGGDVALGEERSD